MGRVILNRAIWDIYDQFQLKYDPFINEVLGKGRLGDLVYKWFVKYGTEITSELIDRLKRIGFRYSTLMT